MRVLIAEDQNVIRQGLKKIIGEMPGTDVVGAADGAQAWEIYERLPADLVVTDIVMPDMNGLELIEHISSADDACTVIVISGHDKFEYARRAMEYGVRDYLLKPVSREKILSVLRQRKGEFDQRYDRQEKLFRTSWSLAVAMKEEQLKDELEGMKCPSSGKLVVAKSTAGACPLAQDTGFLLCRRLAQISEDTALFAAYGAFESAYCNSDIVQADVLVEKGEDLSLAIARLAGRWKGQEDGVYDGAVRRVLMYVSRHYGEALSLQGVAYEIGLHPNYLSALFTRNMHCGFTRYLQRLRVERAKTLLRTTNRKINDIATVVGFTDGKYFAKVFKAITGISPQQYRSE